MSAPSRHRLYTSSRVSTVAPPPMHATTCEHPCATDHMHMPARVSKNQHPCATVYMTCACQHMSVRVSVNQHPCATVYMRMSAHVSTCLHYCATAYMHMLARASTCQHTLRSETKPPCSDWPHAVCVHHTHTRAYPRVDIHTETTRTLTPTHAYTCARTHTHTYRT